MIIEDKLIYFKIIKLLLFLIIYKKCIEKNNNNENIIIMRQFKEPNLREIINNPINNSNQTIALNKEQLLNLISIYAGKNISSVKYIFLSQKMKFENLIMIINNAIFYCEILQCKNVVLDNKYFWFIKKKVKYKKNKLVITKGNIDDLEKKNLIIDETNNLLNFPSFLKIDYKINVIKNEVLTNLPKVIVYKNDLYIFIKSNYYFKKSSELYIHPPFCFYQAILNYYNFSNVKIISEFRNDPIINKIIYEYKNITYEKIKLKYMISYLVNAYNIVGASSRILNIIIRLSENLLYLWKYEYLNENDDDLYNKKMFVFKMFASKKYIEFLINSQDTFSQIYLVLSKKCENNFTLIKK